MVDEKGHEREVRFAVVIYGGVSLAIYINGVVQEMLNMVRSTHTDDVCTLTKTQRVYRHLAWLVGQPADGTQAEALPVSPSTRHKKSKRPSRVDFTSEAMQQLKNLTSSAADVEAFRNQSVGKPRTKFVVDILSGTSAGGINAIYLAKALTTGASLDSLAKLWITDADVSKLLNDGKVDPRSLRQSPPPSLLNSPWMYVQLLNALQDMSNESRSLVTKDKKAEDLSLVDELDLNCSTTDLEGIPVLLPLTDKGVRERRYKSDFHFVRRPKIGSVRNDLGEEMDPFLAFAARCTSSFPIAFEPMVLDDLAKVINPRNDKYARYISKSTGANRKTTIFNAPTPIAGLTAAEAFERTCPIYSGQDATGQVDFNKRAFADGGYLHNKPFSYAIEVLKKRSATIPVDRKLVYIEPEPESFSPGQDKSVPIDGQGNVVRQDALENGLAALLILPRYQTIREDIQSVVEWNSNIARLRRVIEDLEGGVKAEAAALIEPEKYSSWQKTLCYASYLRLRLSSAADQIAARLAAAMNLEPNSVEGSALRVIAGEWRDRDHGGHDVAASDLEKRIPESYNRKLQLSFLHWYDFDFVRRALRYLRTRLVDAANQNRKLNSDEIAKLVYRMNKRLDECTCSDPEFNLDTQQYSSWLACLKFVIDATAAGWVLDPLGEAFSQESLSATDDGYAARVCWLFEHPDHPVGFILDPTIATTLLSEVGIKPSSELEQTGAAGCAARSKWVHEQLDQDDSPLAKRLLPLSFQAIKQHVIQQLRAYFGSSASYSKIEILLGTSPDPEDTTLAYAYIKFDELTGQPLGTSWREFEVQDTLVFPIVFGTELGEFETVDLFRISPVDAGPIPGFVNNSSEHKPLLKGSSLMAFGGFLDQSWRLNDMLRGRLDGADRLITAVLPDADPLTVQVREMLIREAQEEILIEWKAFQKSLGFALEEL